MDSSSREIDDVVPKTPLENLQGILAKADALAASVLPPETKAIFSIEGEGSETVSRIRAVLTALQQCPQETLSRQRLADLFNNPLGHRNNEIPVDNEPNLVEIKMVYSENIKKLDEIIKSLQMTKATKGHCH